MPTLPMSDTAAGDWRDAEIGDFALYCCPDDGNARLKTVYTGTDSPPVSPTNPWYRPL